MNRSCHIIIQTLLVAVCLSISGLAAEERRATEQPKSRLDRFDVQGNREFSRREIQNWFQLKAGDYTSNSDLRERSLRALKQLKDQGFYFATVDSMRMQFSKDSTEVDVVVHLTEGEALRIGELEVVGLLEGDDVLLDGFRTKPGRVFNERNLQQDIASVINYYEDEGYPYCQVTIRDLSQSHNRETQQMALDITIDVSPGTLALLDVVEIRGNEATKDYVILRELGIQAGEIYDHSRVEQIPARLIKLGYFKWVNPARLEWRANSTGKLIIELAEGSHNRFNGILGYNPPAGNSDGFVSGLIDIAFGNLLGTGREAKVYWQRRTAKTQELKVAYQEPWVLGWPLNLGLSFAQVIQDTIYIERNFEFDGRFRVNQSLAFFSRFGSRSVSPDSLGAVLFGVPRSRSLNATLGLSFDTIDYIRNPSSGVLYNTSFEWRRKTVEPSRFDPEPALPSENQTGSFNQRVLVIDLETYLSPFRWQVLAIGLHGREITSNEDAIAISDQFRFGGTRDLRGYREEQFRGSRIAWANIEYRYLLNRDSRLFAFVDTGYFSRGEGEAEVTGANLGYGFGLRIDTRLGFFGIDYGLGEGDGLSNGKVHIRLTNAF